MRAAPGLVSRLAAGICTVATVLASLSACRERVVPSASSGARESAASVQASAPPKSPGAPSSERRRLGPLAYPGCEAHAGPLCDLRNDACQARLFGLMQCLYGLTTAARPNVRFVAPAQLDQRAHAFRSRAAAVRAPLEFAAGMLGLHAARSNAAKARSLAPNALYLPGETEVWFAENAAIDSDSELAFFVLGHEFVHALQDRYGALKSALATRDRRSFDAELALFSAVEGEAALYEEILRSLHYRKPARDWVPARIRERTDVEDSEVARQRNVLDAAFGAFPYAYGAHWATEEWLAHGRFLRDAAAPPVETSRFVMSKRHGFPALAHSCNRVLPTSLAGNRSLAAHEELGAWLIHAFVRKLHGNDGAALAAARDSAGDTLAVYAPRAGEADAFVWATCWASESAALRMQGELERHFQKLGTLRYAVRTHGREAVTVALRTDLAAELDPERVLSQLFAEPQRR